jgi:hypothetical protein
MWALKNFLSFISLNRDSEFQKAADVYGKTGVFLRRLLSLFLPYVLLCRISSP